MPAWGAAGGLLLFAAASAAALLSFSGAMADPSFTGGLKAALSSPSFLAAVGLYAASHLLRAFRLLLLLLETERSYARVLRMHAALAWTALLLPLKPLGDLLRMLEISHDQENAPVGPFVVIAERFLDAVVILALAATAGLLSPGSLPDLSPLVAALALVAAAAAALYFGLPGFLAYARAQVVRRSVRNWPLLLPWLERLERLLVLGHKLVHARIGVLLAVSAAIWCVEWACVSALYRSAAGPAGGTWLPALLKAFAALLKPGGSLMTEFPYYGTAVFSGLGLLGLPFWLSYCRARAASGRGRWLKARREARRYRLTPYLYGDGN